jgi:hypothetical protein
MPSITITHYKDAKNPMQIDQKDDALPGCHVEWAKSPNSGYQARPKGLVIILYAENAMHRKNGQEEGKKVRFAWWRDTSIWSSILQEDGEAEEDAAEESGEAETSVGHEDGASAALVAAVVAVAGTSLGSAAEAGDGDGVCSYAVGASWCRGGRHGGGEGGVASVRFLSTAWVVLAVELS